MTNEKLEAARKLSERIDAIVVSLERLQEVQDEAKRTLEFATTNNVSPVMIVRVSGVCVQNVPVAAVTVLIETAMADLSTEKAKLEAEFAAL